MITVFNLKFHLFIAPIQKSDQLLYITLVFCNLAIIAYQFQEFHYFGFSTQMNVSSAEIILFLPFQSYIFMSYCISQNFQYDMEVPGLSWGNFEFLTIKYDVSCWIFWQIFLIRLRKFPSISGLLKLFVLSECWRADTFLFFW